VAKASTGTASSGATKLMVSLSAAFIQ